MPIVFVASLVGSCILFFVASFGVMTAVIDGARARGATRRWHFWRAKTEQQAGDIGALRDYGVNMTEAYKACREERDQWEKSYYAVSNNYIAEAGKLDAEIAELKKINTAWEKHAKQNHPRHPYWWATKSPWAVP